MEKTTIALIAQAHETEQAAAPAATDLRPLADWELVMAGGGETTPDW